MLLYSDDVMSAPARPCESYSMLARALGLRAKACAAHGASEHHGQENMRVQGYDSSYTA